MRCCLLLCILSLFAVSSVSSPTLLGGPIKHVIVLMEENRSFDHFFGWFKGANGLSGEECNGVMDCNGTRIRVCVDKNAKDLNPCDPDHTTDGTTAKIFGVHAFEMNTATYPTMSGFAQREFNLGHQENKSYCGVMSTFTPDHLPVISQLAKEFVLMDRFFADHPGPTWPNRLFALSATSAGLTETHSWFRNQTGQLFPQQTIFDQVAHDHLSWKVYYNDTPWELFLATLAHHPENLDDMEQFYLDARNGALPNFAWINPRLGTNVKLNLMANDDHPDHDVALGEQYYKDIYEAIRASPQWNETLFIITFDEHGGFYDHVPPPMGVPPPDNFSSYPNKAEFNRLGLRIPTLLISPWVSKGILSEPPTSQKPAPNSEYTLSSIIATTRKLLGLSSEPLTKRDAWAATFEHVFNLAQPRNDCSIHLPLAPPLSGNRTVETEAALPLNDLQKQVMTMHANLVGEEVPAHITTQGQVADYTRAKLSDHFDNHQRWLQSRVHRTTQVVVVPDAKEQPFNVSWYCNRDQTVKYITFSSNRKCLDYDISNGFVGVSSCHPKAAPQLNLAITQQWIWEEDSTIRPYDNQSLCLTSSILSVQPNESIQEAASLFLLQCDEGVSQHWAWHGGLVPETGRKKGKISMGYYYVASVNSTSILFA